jgi:hypothetical protein
MVVVRRQRMAPCLLLSGLVIGMLGTLSRAQTPAETQNPPPLAGPQQPPPPPPPAPQPPSAADNLSRRVEALPATSEEATTEDQNRRASDEARAERAAETAARVYVPHEPPPPIAERPSGERPDPKAVWTSGYWEWDPATNRFVWVAGSWRIPPAGMVWTAGRWRHDNRGWYWVAGSWKRPTNATAVVRNRRAWQIKGPPAEQPDDTPPPAPGPDFFYVPGHYSPTAAGENVAWIPGFWAAQQPGWDWIPARWVRRPDGWDYREGHWVRDAATTVVERVPARERRRLRGNAKVRVNARDPITGAEVDVEANGDPAPVAGVVTAVPYYVIRPPGAYPYGPGGVVVPGTVPPFVRRILDQVLP